MSYNVIDPRTVELGAAPGRFHRARGRAFGASVNYSTRPLKKPRVKPATGNYSFRGRAAGQTFGERKPRLTISSAGGALTTALPPNYLALPQAAFSGYEDDGLGFSLKPPKWLRKAAMTVKKAVTLKHVLEAGAIVGGAILAAPILLPAAGALAHGAVAAGGFLGREVAAGARGLFGAGKAVDSAIGKAVGGVFNHGINSTPTGTPGTTGDKTQYDANGNPVTDSNGNPLNTPAAGGGGGGSYSPPTPTGGGTVDTTPTGGGGTVPGGAPSPGYQPTPPTADDGSSDDTSTDTGTDQSGDDQQAALDQSQAASAETVAPPSGGSGKAILIGVGILAVGAMIVASKRKRRVA